MTRYISFQADTFIMIGECLASANQNSKKERLIFGFYKKK